jgi:hypothetical protein
MILFPKRLKIITILFFCLISPSSLLYAQEKKIQKNMAAAATALIQTFTPQQKSLALLSFNDSERLRWSNEPQNLYTRKGITTGDLNKNQKIALHRLLQTVLSEQGYFKAINVMRLDDYLHDTALKKGNDAGKYEGSNKYWLTIFGNPDANHNWSWRFEGHHLSLNFTNTPDGITCTPMFFGADPATFPIGPFAGWQNMFAETNRGWQLFLSLNTNERSKAVVSNKTPKAHDILTRTGKEAFLQNFQGISFNRLSPAQQKELKQLVAVYADNLNDQLAADYLHKIQWKKIYFGWWGSKTRGKPVYYRIHGPDFIIEYISRLNDPDHIHTLFRYLPTDFGGKNKQ